MIFARPFLLVILLTGIFLSGFAQVNYRVARFTTDNALPSNGIKGLQWDESTGFLWIATEAGVTRYNGSDFVTWSRTNTPEFSSERMLFMLKNQDGRIYTSDENGDIFFVMQNRLQFMERIRLDTRPSTFKLIGLAGSGKLFKQSLEKPSLQFGFNFLAEVLLPLSETRVILFRKDSLYDYQAGHQDPIPLTAIEPGSAVFHTAGQLFVFHPQRGFLRFDPDTRTQRPIPLVADGQSPLPRLKNTLRLFWQHGTKSPLLIDGPRAWTLSYMDGQLVSHLICDAVPTDALLSFALYNEKKALLFLGANSKGLIVISRNKVRPVRATGPATQKVSSTYSQLALDNGTILTSQGDVLGGPPPPPSHRPVKGIFNNFIYTDPDSVLWYSQSDTIYAYAYKTRTTTAVFAGEGSITDGFARCSIPSGYPTDPKDPRNLHDLYVANAIGIGVLRDSHVDYLYRYPTADINSNVPFSMLEISPGKLAIACCNGLFRFDIHTRRLDTMWQSPGACVRALWKYKDYLFIGTYGKGIFIWKAGVLRPIPSDKNNYLRYAHCFVPDKQGFCWISTNRGLFRTRPADMVSAFENNDRTVYYHYYGRNDGLDITELNGGCTPCALALNDSTVSFPSMDGLVWVDPSAPADQLPEGNVYIDGFTADGQKINTTSLRQPELPAGARELTFMLGYPSWVNNENIYIEYKLEPWSKDWTPLDPRDNPALHFSNLPSGSYQLTIRKLNGFGSNNYTLTAITFRIGNHWYQQLWVWIFGLCCLTALVIWIVRLRTWQFEVRQHRLEYQIAEKTRELKLKNEELEKTDSIKTRLISIISHDLVTPLKFLHLAGKNLIEKKSQLTEELQRETITEIMNTSKELELLSTNILNWIKYRNEDRRLAKESFNLHLLVTQLCSLFNAMARQKQIRLINRIDEQLSLYQYIEPVKIVLYNLILNGINFTSEGHILVTSALTADGVTIAIEDTGVGMTQDQINNIMADHFIISSANVDRRKGNGLGYLIIKDLLKIIRGSLTIQSGKGKGTRVLIRLPADSAILMNEAGPTDRLHSSN